MRTRPRGFTIAIVVVVVAGAGALEWLRQRSEDEPPRNLLILCLDTLRWDHLGVSGYDRPTSPRIDAVALGGAVFDRAYAQSSWTAPSTASLLTGLLPSTHRYGRKGGQVKSLAMTPLRSDVRSLAQILSEAGFRTGLFSANPYLRGRLERGFEESEVATGLDAAALSGKALTWIEQLQEETRFFAYLQFMDLHEPIDPPEPYFNYFPAAYGGERDRRHMRWAFGKAEDLSSPAFRRFRSHKIALYDGALRYLDAEIGRLLDRLAELQILDRTLVVITSDHGEEFWEHAEIEQALGGDPRGVYGVGHGHSMFQELLHVPLILSGKAVSKKVRIDSEVALIDVAPTVLQLLGLQGPAEMQGRSLVDITRKGPVPASRPRPVVAEEPGYGVDTKAIIMQRRKLIQRSDGPSLLFDLRTDAEERHDLSSGNPQLVAQMERLLAASIEGDSTTTEEETLVFDEGTTKELRALGYLD